MRKVHATMWARARCWALWMAVIALEAADDALLASMNRRIAGEVIAGLHVGGRS